MKSKTLCLISLLLTLASALSSPAAEIDLPGYSMIPTGTAKTVHVLSAFPLEG